jgi:hypothetical protein
MRRSPLIAGIAVALAAAVSFGILDVPSTGDESSGVDVQERIDASITGRYSRSENALPQGSVSHVLRARDIEVELVFDPAMLENQPRLRSWRDALDAGSVRPNTAIHVVGSLSRNPRNPHDPCRLVCTVRQLSIPAGQGVAATAHPDAQIARKINEQRGLTAIFQPQKDPKRTLIKLIEESGLTISNKDPERGMIFADLAGTSRISPELVGKIKNSPGFLDVSPRRATGSAKVGIPHGEVPTAIEKGDESKP